jgi:hypothetical protein
MRKRIAALLVVLRVTVPSSHVLKLRPLTALTDFSAHKKRRSTGMRRIAILLTAAISTVLLYQTMVVHAADVASPVEAETFDVKPTGTSVVTNTTLYSNG